MSTDSEIDRLEAEIEEKKAERDRLKAPMTLAEASQLAKENPDEFNDRWENARRNGRDPIKKETTHE